jgi:murein DD-endopeptidase MepM/ murein hydrolase activator NlpD
VRRGFVLGLACCIALTAAPASADETSGPVAPRIGVDAGSSDGDSSDGDSSEGDQTTGAPTATASPTPTPTASPRPTRTPRPTATPSPTRSTATPTPAAGEEPAPRPGAEPAADPEAQAKADRDEALHDLGDTSAEMLEAVAALRAAERGLPAAKAQLADVRAQLATARAAAQKATAAAQAAQAQLTAEIEASEQAAAQVDAQRAQLGRIARTVYQQGQLTDLARLLDSDSPSELVDRYAGLRVAVRAQRADLADLESAAETHRDRLTGLERRRAEHARASQQARAGVQEAEKLEAAAVAAQQSVQGLVQARAVALEAALAAVAEDDLKAAQRQRIAGDLQATLARLAADLDAEATAASVRPGLLLPPVRGPVTSPYGMRVHPVTGVYKLHSGTDFGVACGTPVGAALGGTVLQTGRDSAYGNRVVIQHGAIDGAVVATTYNHLESIAVREGQVVAPGSTVGFVGSTGYSTGCHLHLELLVGGEFVDPAPWLAP